MAGRPEPHRRGARVRRRAAAGVRRAPRRAARGACRTPATARRRRAPRLPRGDALGARGGLAVAPAPPDLQDRRVEITGPVDRKMVINALNSGRALLHGRLRGRQRADLVEHARGPGQPRATPSGARSSSPARTGASIGSTRAATLLVRPRGWHLPETPRARRRRAGLGAACSTSASTSSTTRGPARARERAVLLPAEAREPPRGPSVERRLRAGRRTGSGSARHDPRDGPDRDDPGRVRDGRDPVRAARPLGRTERRTLGLHLQRDQEVPRAIRSSCCPIAPRSR